MVKMKHAGRHCRGKKVKQFGAMEGQRASIETIEFTTLSMPATLRRPFPKLQTFRGVRSFSRHRDTSPLTHRQARVGRCPPYEPLAASKEKSVLPELA
jgi:hypothetical protein